MVAMMVVNDAIVAVPMQQSMRANAGAGAGAAEMVHLNGQQTDLTL